MSRARKWITSSFPGEEIKSQIERILSSSNPVKELEGHDFSVIPDASYMVYEYHYSTRNKIGEKDHSQEESRYVIFCTSIGEAIRVMPFSVEHEGMLLKMLDRIAPKPEIFSYQRVYWPGFHFEEKGLGSDIPGYMIFLYDHYGNSIGYHRIRDKHCPSSDFLGLKNAVEREPDYDLEVVTRRYKFKYRLREYVFPLVLFSVFFIGCSYAFYSFLGTYIFVE